MQRILVLGDVHIGDYSRYNNIANRLGQFDTLADRLCQLECDSVIIAGDLLLNCIMKPRVMHSVKRFLTKLTTRFNNVYYILGNHDLDIKLKGFSGSDSLVTLMDMSNLHYMHDKHLKVEDVDIYFMDWIKSHEVPLNDNCDIFISHINLMPGFGQVVDNTRFKLGIFGDYHSRYQVDNMMTTGTPIQHKLDDPTEPMVLELTINGNEFHTNWIPLETDSVHFLKMYRESNFPSNPTAFDVCIKSGKKSQQGLLENKVQFELSTEISKYLKDAGLYEEHCKVVELHGDIEPIDMDFQVLKLWGFNYRSIKEVSFEFDPNKKVVFLSGANGSGKSSFMRLLISAIFGDNHLRDRITKGESWNEVDVDILYQGRVHSIQRGNGSLKYKIDGVYQDANNIRSLQDSISHNLNFIQYLGDFIVDSHTTFFNKCDRLGLFTRLFELDRYSLYSDSAMEIRNELQSEYDSISTQINELSTESGIYSNQIKEMESNLGEKPNILDRSILESDISKLTEVETILIKKSSEFNFLVSNVDGIHPDGTSPDLDKIRSIIKSFENEKSKESTKLSKFIELRNKQSELNRLLKMISNGVKYKCESCGHEGIYKEVPTEISDAIKKLNSEIDGIKSEIKESESDIKVKIANLDREINNFNNSIRDFERNKSNRIKAEKLRSELDNLISTYGQLDKVRSDKERETNSLFQLDLYLNKLNQLNSVKNKLSECKSKSNELKLKLDEISPKISSYDKYISLFDIYNLDSIPNKVLKSITSSISDDVMEFTTEKELKSGKTKFKVSCKMNIDGNWIDFDELSDGQQAYVSLKILSKLSNCLPKVGLVILDEPLKHVDENNLYSCIDSLKSINCNNLIISSHSPSYNYADEVLNFELVDGISVISKE